VESFTEEDVSRERAEYLLLPQSSLKRIDDDKVAIQGQRLGDVSGKFT
jgi:hypothetical protein